MAYIAALDQINNVMDMSVSRKMLAGRCLT
jgi:hypothetical protein